MMRSFLFLLLCSLVLATTATAESSVPAVRICTENLHNYQPPARVTRSARARKKAIADEAALVQRFVDAQCDVIAVQEVMGRTTKEASSGLRVLASKLALARGQKVQAFVSDTFDGRIRNGFLLLSDKFRDVSTEDFSDRGLPRLQPEGPPHYFRRTPFVLRAHSLAIPKRQIVLINIHLKSKADGWKDRTGLSYEPVRMEMAEAVRRYSEALPRSPQEDPLLVILGDRNTDEHSAATDILSGRRVLADFQAPPFCRVEKELRSICPDSRKEHPLELVPLLGENNARCISCPTLASYRYQGELSLLDEIFVPAQDRQLFLDPRGFARVGIMGIFQKGSDHKLAWAELR